MSAEHDLDKQPPLTIGQKFINQKKAGEQFALKILSLSNVTGDQREGLKMLKEWMKGSPDALEVTYPFFSGVEKVYKNNIPPEILAQEAEAFKEELRKIRESVLTNDAYFADIHTPNLREAKDFLDKGGGEWPVFCAGSHWMDLLVDETHQLIKIVAPDSNVLAHSKTGPITTHSGLLCTDYTNAGVIGVSHRGNLVQETFIFMRNDISSNVQTDTTGIAISSEPPDNLPHNWLFVDIPEGQEAQMLVVGIDNLVHPASGQHVKKGIYYCFKEIKNSSQ